MQKKIILITVFLMVLQAVFAQNSEESEGSQKALYTAKQQQLRITADNVRLVPDSTNGGYHLYVKRIPDKNLL